MKTLANPTASRISQLAALALSSVVVTGATAFPIAECGLFPNDPVFDAGKYRVNHFAGSSDKGPSTFDAYRIRLPVVNVPAQVYREVSLKGGDTVNFVACGCVQTGGVGKTWKRYVDPLGPNSDRLYRGVAKLLIDGEMPPNRLEGLKNWPTLQGLMRNKIALSVPQGHSAVLALGYLDDNYGDNGYSGHDDGTDNQCKGTGGAAVEVTVTHR
jgi:hypothetical protein